MVLIAGNSFCQESSAWEDRPEGFEPIWSKDYVSNNADRGTCEFLIFEDNLPWGETSVVDILTANSESFTVAGSSQMATLDFSLFDVIVVEGDQIVAFHVNFVASFAKFNSFVQNGGRLEVHACVGGWNSGSTDVVTLPGGVYTSQLIDDYNDVAMPSHPIVAGVPSPFSGSFASHGVFNALVAGTDIIATAQLNGEPTTIQYSWGLGTVTATTSPYEYAYPRGQSAGIMLENNLNYSCSGYVPPSGVPISDWAIYFGIFLIGLFVIFRFRRRLA